MLRFAEALELTEQVVKSLEDQPDADVALKQQWQTLWGLNRMRVESSIRQYPLKQLWLDARDACLSPNGTQVATLGPDGVVRLWDVKTGVTENTFAPAKEPKPLVYRVLFNADGSRLLTLSDDNIARVWHPSRNQIELELPHESTVRHAAFCQLEYESDAKKEIVPGVCTITEANELTIWDAETGQRLPQPSQPGDVVALSPTGMHALIARDSNLVLFDVIHANSLKEWPLPESSLIAQAAFSANGERFAVAFGAPDAEPQDKPVPAVDFRSERNPLQFVSKAQVPADGGGEVWAVSTATGQQWAWRLDGFAGVKLLRVSADGSRVFCAVDDSTAWVWDLKSDEKTQLPLPRDPVLPLLEAAFDSTNRYLALGWGDEFSDKPGLLMVWDVKTATPLSGTLGHNRAVSVLEFDRQSLKLLAAGGNNTLGETRLWDLESLKDGSRFLTGSEESGTVIFDPNDRFVFDYQRINGSDDVKRTAWKATNGTLTSMPPEYQKTWGRWKFTALTEMLTRIEEQPTRDGGVKKKPISSTNTVIFKDLEKFGLGELSDEDKQRLNDAVQGLPENPVLPGTFDVVTLDQQRLLTQLGKTPEAWALDPSNEIRVWDLTTGQPVTRPLDHWGKIGSAIFSEGGRFLATGSLDGSARVWSVETSEPITPRLWHGQAVVPRASAGMDGCS